MSVINVRVLHGFEDDSCTNGGVTANKRCAVLVYDCEYKDSLAEIGSEDCPVLLLKVKPRLGKDGADYLYAVPVQQPKGKAGPTDGGNFVYTSDSRFPSDYPIPVHDRFE